jgi:hypothetical protein
MPYFEEVGYIPVAGLRLAGWCQWANMPYFEEVGYIPVAGLRLAG